jgi:bzd-type benzoyl-CoA reductase N subunit
MIQEFSKIFANRYNLTRERENQGQKVVGWVCTYVPEEMISAAGMLPIRVMGASGDTSVADGYLYSNICSFARGCLEEGLKGNYDFLSGYVAVNSCDNIRRLYEVWSRYCKTSFTHIIKLPHKITPDSIAYFRSELVHFKECLEKFTGKEITDSSLQEAISLYNQTRLLLKQLYELRKTDSPPISGAETLDVILAGLVMPKEIYNQRLESLLHELSAKEGIQDDRLRILLVGSELDNAEYIQVIEELGGLVVTDDLCNGTRYFWDLVEVNGDPVGALAKRYLTKAPCARMRPPTERLERIKQMIKEYRIDGIIYEMIKFCDLYGEDYPIFRDGLNELDVPILTLNREYTLTGVGQMKTRIQAFFEKIGL